MQQFPSLPRGDQLQPAYVCGFRVFFVEVDVPQDFFDFLVVGWGLFLHLRLHDPDLFLIAGLEALRHEILRDELGKVNFAMVYLFTQIIDRFH